MISTSFNTLGTKNVKKAMLKITKGRVRDQGVTWFPELVDKRMWCVDIVTEYILVCNI